MRHTGAVRIALVHYSYLPTVAGVELMMAQHARLFAEDGHAVAVVAAERGEAPDGISHVAIASLSPRSPLARRAQAELEFGGVGVAFEQAVAALIAELRPIFASQDLIILHNVATMHFHLALTTAVSQLADDLPRVRFICWIHDLAACNPDYSPLPLDREPWLHLTRAHPRYTYVAVSELRRRQFSAITAQPLERCRTIPNGVEPTRLLDLSQPIASLAKRWRLFDREIVLLQPARLLRRKNVELTLRVTAALRDAGTSCAALITAPAEIHSGASAAYAQELRELRADLDLENHAYFLSEFLELDDAAVRELFGLADALFFPSRSEGFGLPLIEAALHRLPIFCADIEPLRSLLPTGTTTFSLVDSPQKIAALISSSLDANPAHRARAHTLREFSWTAIYRNFLSPLLAETEPPLPA